VVDTRPRFVTSDQGSAGEANGRLLRCQAILVGDLSAQRQSIERRAYRHAQGDAFDRCAIGLVIVEAIEVEQEAHEVIGIPVQTQRVAALQSAADGGWVCG
jgi:hypothetical protein